MWLIIAGITCYSICYGGLERWLCTGEQALNIRSMEPKDRHFFGLGIPYHLPLMLSLFLCVIITPMIPYLLVDKRYWLLVASIGFLSFLVEDFTVQICELAGGDGWITKDDWSSKWGSIPIPFTEESVVPIWYPVYLFLSGFLYYLFL